MNVGHRALRTGGQQRIVRAVADVVELERHPPAAVTLGVRDHRLHLGERGRLVEVVRRAQRVRVERRHRLGAGVAGVALELAAERALLKPQAAAAPSTLAFVASYGYAMS